VVDDGSTDDTDELLASIQDSRMSCCWQENAGQTVAKNRGIELSMGVFVAFCDADDYWYPEKLELQIPIFEECPKVGVVYSSADMIDEAGSRLNKSLGIPFHGDVLHELFLTNFVPFGTAVVRKECIDAVGNFDATLSMGIDWDLWLRIATHYDFDCYAGHTYAYRVWPGQMSRDWRGRYDAAFDIMEKYEREHPGRIQGALKRRAYASTYANRARDRASEGASSAIRDCWQAISTDPTYFVAWKTMGRILVDALGEREGRSKT
jgi:glycosyltransferase involved in cell wall biosynthesis